MILALRKVYYGGLGRKDRQGGNGIKSNAVDIYAEEVHFLKELIQNADDNEYDVSVDASLKFNFTEKQIIAICSNGESTKKERHDNIGEKGIGFKSVFKVSPNVVPVCGFMCRNEITSKGN